VHEAAVVGCSSAFLLLLFFMARVYFSLILQLMVTVLIKEGKKQSLERSNRNKSRNGVCFKYRVLYNAMDMSNKILVQQITHCHANVENYPRKFNVFERRQNFSETDLQSIERFFFSSPPGLGDT